jgi:hypothetical protein
MIRSVEEFVVTIREDATAWPAEQPAWFRSEPAGGKIDENVHFRGRDLRHHIL